MTTLSKFLSGYRSIAFAAIVAFVGLAGLATAADPASDGIARLGSTDIPTAELLAFIASLPASTRQQALGDPALMKSLVRVELARIAVLREAKAQKWDQRPDIAARLARARDQELVSSFLRTKSAPAADFPSDAEIEAAYEQSRDSFLTPRQYHLQQIYIAVPAGADAAAQKMAEQKASDLARQVKSPGADFADLARHFSEHKSSADKGGDLGWLAEEEIVPEIKSQIGGMSNDDISEPIRSATGWHIVRMLETKPAGVRPLAEVRDSVIAALRQKKMNSNEEAYVEGLFQKTPPQVNADRLKELFATAP